MKATKQVMTVSSTYDILRDGMYAAFSPSYTINTNGVVSNDTDPATFTRELRRLSSGMVACIRTIAPRSASLHANHPMSVALNITIAETIRDWFGQDVPIPSTDFTHDGQLRNFADFKNATSRQLVVVVHFRVESDTPITRLEKVPDMFNTEHARFMLTSDPVLCFMSDGVTSLFDLIRQENRTTWDHIKKNRKIAALKGGIKSSMKNPAFADNEAAFREAGLLKTA